MGSLGAASSESGAGSPWSVAADWHRVVRDLVFPVRLWVESVDVSLSLCVCGSVIGVVVGFADCPCEKPVCSVEVCVCVSRLPPVFLNRFTGKGEQKAIVEQKEGEQESRRSRRRG